MCINVRSIVAKFPDIEQDVCLKSVSILSFTETWFTRSLSSLVLQENHTGLDMTKYQYIIKVVL